MAECLQAGVKIELKPLALDFERVNPVTGIRRILSGAGQVWEQLCRLTSVLMIGGLSVGWAVERYSQIAWHDKVAVVPTVNAELSRTALVLLLVIGCGAAFDLLLRRRAFNRELSMSHEEIKDEHKETEGQPLTKSLRRAMHESIAMQDLVRRVRNSKVVVVRRARRSN